MRRVVTKNQIISINDALKKYVFVKSINRIADLETGELMTRDVFNATHRGIAPAGAGGENAAFALWMNSDAMRVNDISYLPGADPIYFEGDGKRALSFYNSWRPGLIEDTSAPPVKDADIAPWLEHIAFILSDEIARELFLNWAAYLIQKPGGKINWAFVLIGPQGVGKDAMLRPLYGILGKDNCQAITAKDLEGDFTDWAENQLIIVEELPSFKKRDVYDWLKRYVAQGVPHFRVNKKNVAQYNVRNVQNWFIMSNHVDALALECTAARF
jgi:hypothetical protein